MIKSITLFNILLITGSILSLFIPLWFMPFFFGMLVSFLFNVSKSRTILSHLISYTLVGLLFCYYSYTTGSPKLVQMISELFNGLPIPVMIFGSSLISGITASLGAWLGVESKGIIQLKSSS